MNITAVGSSTKKANRIGISGMLSSDDKYALWEECQDTIKSALKAARCFNPDEMQESWITFCDCIEKFNPDKGDFRVYLFVTVRTRAHDRRRRQHRLDKNLVEFDVGRCTAKKEEGNA